MRTRIPRPTTLAGGALLLTFTGCAFAGELLGEAGEGALQTLSSQLQDQSGKAWASAWEQVDGRGVGVAPRAIGEAVALDCGDDASELPLYTGPRLRDPRSVVPTRDGRVTRDDVAAVAPRLRLPPGPGPRAIVLIRTTADNGARALLDWSGESPRLESLVVEDPAGLTLSRSSPVSLQPGLALDLDPDGSGAFDLMYGRAPDGTRALGAAPGAALSLPTRSLCER